MIDALTVLGKAISYTDETVIGGGAIKGSPCYVKSTETVEDGVNVTFGWTLADDTEKTSTIKLKNGKQGEQGVDGRGIKRSYVDANEHFIIVYDDDTEEDCGAITVVGIDTLEELKDVELESLADGDVFVYDAEKGKWVNGKGGSGGDSSLSADVTSNLAVGAIASGTTLPKKTTFTEFVQKLLITEIAPTTTFSASGSGVKETGTSVTPTLTLNITNKGTGTPTAIKFYNGSVLLDTQNYVEGTNTYTHTMTDVVNATTTVKGVLEYKKSDNTNASVEKSATYTFVMASYYGAVTTAPTTKAEIIALTKNVKTSKGQTATFTLNNQRSCYAYPASMGNLTSIKDSNNFEYINSYTKTTVTVDGVAYNVYTLTDPVTATGFKQVYA